MYIFNRTSGIAIAVALMATPACAAAASSGTPDGTDSGTAHQQSSDQNGNRSATPGPRASLPAKAKAYGKYCKTESKKRSDATPGTKGSPFSQCVTAMAKLANGQTKSPRGACKPLSKKHSDAQPGTHGSPFSQCVSGGAKLLRHLSAQDQQPSGDQSTDAAQEQTSTS